MPRDGSGVYTLPAGNPVATATLIQSAWANPTMADIAVQLNNVLTRDGVLGPVLPLKLVDGTVAAPGLAFNAEAGTGLYRPSASVLNWASVNAVTASLDASSATGTAWSIYPRTAGTGTLSVASAPYGTANRTDLVLQQGVAGATVASVAFGSGVLQPITYTASSHVFNGPVTFNGSTTDAPAGMFAHFMRASAPAGWVAGNGGTIGNVGSGATRANVDTLALFTLWWTDFNDATLPIQTSAGGASTRGASAAADWAANKRLTVFDVRNRFTRSSNNAATVTGIAYGESIISHGHAVTDPTHTHGVADPGHDHNVGSKGTSGGPGVVDSGTASSSGALNTDIRTTGIAIGYGATGIGIQATGGTETRPINIGMLGCFKL